MNSYLIVLDISLKHYKPIQNEIIIRNFNTIQLSEFNKNEKLKNDCCDKVLITSNMSNISLQYFKYCIIITSLNNLKTLKKLDNDYLFDTKITIVNVSKSNTSSHQKIFGIVRNFTYFKIEYKTLKDCSKSFMNGIINPMFIKKKIKQDTLDLTANKDFATNKDLTYYQLNTPVIDKLFYYNKYITEGLISTSKTTLSNIIYRSETTKSLTLEDPNYLITVLKCGSKDFINFNHEVFNISGFNQIIYSNNRVVITRNLEKIKEFDINKAKKCLYKFLENINIFQHVPKITPNDFLVSSLNPDEYVIDTSKFIDEMFELNDISKIRIINVSHNVFKLNYEFCKTIIEHINIEEINKKYNIDINVNLKLLNKLYLYLMIKNDLKNVILGDFKKMVKDVKDMLIKFYNHDEKVKRLSKIMRTNSMF